VTYFDLLPPEVEGEECDPVVQQRVVDYMAQWTAAAPDEEEKGEEEGGGRGRGRKRRRNGGVGGFTANLKEKKDFGNPELLQRVGREGGREGGRFVFVAAGTKYSNAGTDRPSLPPPPSPPPPS